MPGPESVIAASGFRDYDARWLFPSQMNLEGAEALGLGIGTQMWRHGLRPEIVCGHDLRSYSADVQAALKRGMCAAGITVHDIGLSLTPTAYFARDWLGVGAVAMVTASHNPNGWTGVKMGFAPPLTHGPEEMAELRNIVLAADFAQRPGGGIVPCHGVRAAYLDDLASGGPLHRRCIVVATGNGTAGAFAPDLLSRLGVDVVPLHTGLDDRFPHYNPNPEALEMLHDMARAVRQEGADLALGFDGDGDRLGVVDGNGTEVFADKIGVLLAREMLSSHPQATFIADVKSTGLFASDPALAGRVTYGKTGHSHMKRQLQATGALAAFEKSGHFFFAPPIGRGYDCALRAAVELLRLLDRHPGKTLAGLVDDLPKVWTSPTMSPFCPDDQKRAVAARLRDALAGMQHFAGEPIQALVTTDGVRVQLQSGSWGLIRASSNTPNLVVVCESTQSEAGMRGIFTALEDLIAREPAVGAWDQKI